jgi:hypothetical protein
LARPTQYLPQCLDHGSLTDGSRSTKIDRGTYLPLAVSVKKVSKDPALSAAFDSGSRRPSPLSPCSRRYLGDCVHQTGAGLKGGEGVGECTIPRHCSQAAYQPGRCEGGGPGRDFGSVVDLRRSCLREVRVV